MSTLNDIDFQKIISPKFTNETLFEIIQNETKLNDINIENIKFGESLTKGISFLSNIYRFVVEGTGRTGNKQIKKFRIPIIVKVLLKNPTRRKTFRGPDFFENEIIFYQKVWPAFDAFQNLKNMTTKIQPVPKFLAGYCDGVNDFIALEDLSLKGYKGVERAGGLNYDQTVEILKLFAGFHGLSLAFKDQRPKQFEQVVSSLKETYFAEKFRGWYTGLQKLLLEVICDALEKELPPKYLERFQKLIANDFFGKLCDLCNVHGSFSVVNQGDVWMPNFLFQYTPDNKSVKDIIMIDFQLARYTSLSTDITVFLYTCVDPFVLERHFNDFIIEYHKLLSKTIGDYGSSPNLVSLKDLKVDIVRNIPFGIGMSMEPVTLCLYSDEYVDLDKLEGDEAIPLEIVWPIYPFQEKEKRKRIVTFIKHAVDNDFI